MITFLLYALTCYIFLYMVMFNPALSIIRKTKDIKDINSKIHLLHKKNTFASSYGSGANYDTREDAAKRIISGNIGEMPDIVGYAIFGMLIAPFIFLYMIFTCKLFVNTFIGYRGSEDSDKVLSGEELAAWEKFKKEQD